MDWGWTSADPLDPSYCEAYQIALCQTKCQKINVQIANSVRRIIAVLTVGKFSSCLIQNFSQGGKEEASAGAKLAGADAAQEAGLQVL